MTTDTAAPSTNLVWHTFAIRREQHEQRNGHRGMVVWLTGLPGSGKSTIAHTVQERLHQQGLQTVVLDGDNIRHGLCADLGFSMADRDENVRRTGEVAKLFLETGVIVIVALVSPVREARERVRQSLPEGDFIEIYCQCPLSICHERDPKGMYARAKTGNITQFTGVSSPYDPPLAPALILDTGHESVNESVQALTRLLLDRLGR